MSDGPRDYPDRPFIGIGAVVIRGAQVLLIERAKPPRAGEWSLPGGAQHLGERVSQTLVREVLEETGVTVTPGPLLGVVDAIFPDPQGRIRHHYTLIDYLAHWQAGEPKAGDDAKRARWVTRSELGGLGLWHETLTMIERGFDLGSGPISG